MTCMWVQPVHKVYAVLSRKREFRNVLEQRGPAELSWIMELKMWCGPVDEQERPGTPTSWDRGLFFFKISKKNKLKSQGNSFRCGWIQALTQCH